MRPSLRAAIEHARKKGYSDKEIYQALKKKGWPDNKLKSYFHIWKTPIIASLILLAIIIIAILAYTAPNCDQTCFIEKANQCRSAEIEIDRAGTIIQLTTNNCQLQQRIKEFHTDEVDSIKTLFEEKEMTCEYEESQFPEELMKGLTYTGQCQGPLKDAIISIQNLS